MGLTEFNVYKLTSPDGKVYIGCSKDLKSRWKGRLYNSALTEAIERFGWDSFKKEVIATRPTRVEAELVEADEIAAHNATDSRYGYNIATSKGRGGVPSIFKGKHLTEEHKSNIAKAKRKPVRCVETGAVYASIKEAEESNGMRHGNIARVCAGKRKSVFGTHWEYAEVI